MNAPGGSVQQIGGREVLVLEKSLRERAGNLTFEDDGLLGGEAVADRDFEIGILIDHVDPDAGIVLFEKRLGRHRSGAGVLTVVEEDADPITAETQARTALHGAFDGLRRIAVFAHEHA